jgi:class 3 adenylate cyclase/tetratricopeptide (TPR) repeat protein
MPAPPADRPIHERPDATVMLADISGFTALSEKLDPERVTDIVNACFERLEAIVLAHGGIIDEYLGDCVKAVFGFSPATARPTLHAVQAALEIRDAVAAFNLDHDLPSPLGVHVGLDTGHTIGAVMGRPDEDDFLVMGETARTAALLEDASERGEIFVGAATHAATAAEFEYRPRPPVSLDREGSSVLVYELVGRKAARRALRQSERRYATIMFAEVFGFGELSSHMGPTALAELVTTCFGDLRGVVERHGGVVDKYLGDGLMALFGIPNAIEDAPKQAINAAIEMRAHVARFADARELQLAVHVGINTGLVIAGEIGGRVKRDFSAIGDTVNLASRLKDAAPRGAVYAGVETHRHTEDDFEYTAVAPLVLKGKERPVPAFELASTTTRLHRTTGRRAGRMVYSEMVGRDAELETLRGAITALAAGHGSVVTLVGEPGMGKTRLVSEATVVAEELGVAVVLARSLAVGETLSFHPFIDLFRQLAGIDENEPETQALRKLENAITGLVPDVAADAFPFVATLMGYRLSGPDADRIAAIEGDSLEKLIAKSVREVFQALGERRPTIVVFEDLHWIDRTSLNLLEMLVPLVHRQPLLFLHVQRPHFAETGERLLRVVRDRLADRHREIQLHGLEAQHSEALVQSLLNIEDMPRALRTVIAQKAEGNPFYIEEVVRSLIDQGAIEYHDDRFTVTDKIDTVVIPSTIQDVIMARVDRLDESKRQLLQVASVIGRNFYHRIIAAILESEGLDDDLAQLKEKQMLVERRKRWELAVGERTFGEELEYVFQHALAQETIYASLLHKTRKANHLRVAETIEALFADRLAEFFGTLSYHYGRAEQLEQAEVYSFKAGEESARAGASSEALRYFREAARLYGQIHAEGGDPRRKGLLEKNVGLALLNTGELTESIGHFDRALTWFGERVPKSNLGLQGKGAADLVAVLFDLFVLRGRRRLRPGSDRDREFFEIMNARARASVTSDPKRIFFDNIGGVRRMNAIEPTAFAEACGLYAVAGGMFSFSGMSFSVSRRFLELAKGCVASGNLSDEFDCRHLEFTINYLEGQWDRNDLLDDELIERCIRHGLFWDVQTYLGLACDRLFRQGSFAAAERHIERLAELRDVYGYEFAASNRDGELAMLLLEEGKLEAALVTVERYHSARHETPLKVLGLGTKAKAQLLAGDRGGAHTTLAEARAIVAGADVIPPWHLSAFAAAELGHAVAGVEEARARGDVPAATARRARAARRAAVGIARKVAVQRVEIYRLAGTLSWVLDRRAEALRWWDRSLAEGERLRAAPELSRTHAEIARRLGEAGTRYLVVAGRDAQTHATLARRAFETLGLEWDLARLSGLPFPEPADVAVAS